MIKFGLDLGLRLGLGLEVANFISMNIINPMSGFDGHWQLFEKVKKFCYTSYKEIHSSVGKALAS